MSGEEEEVEKLIIMMKEECARGTVIWPFRRCSLCNWPLSFMCINPDVVLCNTSCTCVLSRQHMWVSIATMEEVAEVFLETMKSGTNEEVLKAKNAFSFL